MSAQGADARVSQRYALPCWDCRNGALRTCAVHKTMPGCPMAGRCRVGVPAWRVVIAALLLAMPALAHPDVRLSAFLGDAPARHLRAIMPSDVEARSLRGEEAPSSVVATLHPRDECIADGRQRITECGAAPLQFLPATSWIVRVSGASVLRCLAALPCVAQVGALPIQWKSPMLHARGRALLEVRCTSARNDTCQSPAPMRARRVHDTTAVARVQKGVEDKSIREPHVHAILAHGDDRQDVLDALNTALHTVTSAPQQEPCNELRALSAWHVHGAGAAVRMRPVNASHFGCTAAIIALIEILAADHRVIWVDVSDAHVRVQHNGIGRQALLSANINGAPDASVELGNCTSATCIPPADGYYPGSSPGSCLPSCGRAACDWGFAACSLEQGTSPLTTLALTGATQLIHVADSGIDFRNPLLSDAAAAVTPIRDYRGVPLATHRKIAMYFAAADGVDDTDGHGTHVVGSLAGSPDPLSPVSVAPQLAAFSGTASGSRIVFTDVFCADTSVRDGSCTCPAVFAAAGGCSCPPGQVCAAVFPSDESMTADVGYLAGARISSNSWGNALVTPMYNAQGVDWDQYAQAHPDYLLMFAAGNKGTGTNYATVSMPAVAKNILAVGAAASSFTNIQYMLRSYTDNSAVASCSSLLTNAASAFAGLSLPVCSNPCCAIATVNTTTGIDAVNLALCCGCTIDTIIESAQAARYSPLQLAQLVLLLQRSALNGWTRASFSSIGPTLDGRIKPEVMAPGADVISARSFGKTDFQPACVPQSYPAGGAGWPAMTQLPLTGEGLPTYGAAFDYDYVYPILLFNVSSVPIVLSSLSLNVSGAPSGTSFVIVLETDVVQPNGVITVGTKSAPLVSAPTSAGSTSVTWSNLQWTVPPSHILGVYLYAPVGTDFDLTVASSATPAPITSNCFGAVFTDVLHSASISPAGITGYTLPKRGTSMATPLAAGAAALVREYFTSGFFPTGSPVPANAFSPSAALMRAVMINSASPMTLDFDTYTDQLAQTGFGHVNIPRSLQFASIGSSGAALDLPSLLIPGLTTQPAPPPCTGCLPAQPVGVAQGVDPSIGHAAVAQYCVDVQASTVGQLPLMLTLAWTDPPGSPAASYALVNNLDLEVVTPTGLVLLGNNPESATVQAADARNNLEKMYLAAPAPTLDASGQRLTAPYTVIVRGTFVPQGPQAYSLVISGFGLRMGGSCGSGDADPTASEISALRSSRTALIVAVSVLGALLVASMVAGGTGMYLYRQGSDFAQLCGCGKRSIASTYHTFADEDTSLLK